jgi:hypothetical protein
MASFVGQTLKFKVEAMALPGRLGGFFLPRRLQISKLLDNQRRGFAVVFDAEDFLAWLHRPTPCNNLSSKAGTGN